MRECFLVNVRKASGRRVAGGRMMGRIGALGPGPTAKGLRGWTGVPKAGEEDGMAEEEGRGGCCLRKMGAGVLSMTGGSF